MSTPKSDSALGISKFAGSRYATEGAKKGRSSSFRYPESILLRKIEEEGDSAARLAYCSQQHNMSTFFITAR